MQPATKPSENKVGWPQMHLGKVTILHISLRSIAEYFAKNSLRSLAKFFAIIRFAHLAKEVTFKGQFCIFRFAQHLQNYFKCSLRSLFTNKFVYARDARAQIRPLPRFFRLPNFVLLWAFMAGWMPLYLVSISINMQNTGRLKHWNSGLIMNRVQLFRLVPRLIIKYFVFPIVFKSRLNIPFYTTTTHIRIR